MDAASFTYRLETPFTTDKIRAMREAQLKLCESNGVPEAIMWDVVALADELVCNIIEHSNATWMEFKLAFQPDEEPLLTFKDNGEAFDPTAPKDLPEQHERGMGLGMIRNIAHDVTYRRLTDGVNQILATAGHPGEQHA